MDRGSPDFSESRFFSTSAVRRQVLRAAAMAVCTDLRKLAFSSEDLSVADLIVFSTVFLARGALGLAAGEKRRGSICSTRYIDALSGD